MSFTCTFLSPLMVAFLAVKDSPKLDEPCVTDSSSICSGSSIGTPYFGSPAELPYVSALIKTEVLCTHQLTCYQIGCHLLIHSPSVDTTHFVTITEADRLLLKRKIIHICVTLAWILQRRMFQATIKVSLKHAEGKSYIRVATAISCDSCTDNRILWI